MNIISERIRKEKEYAELFSVLKKQCECHIPHPSRLVGMCEGARNALLATLFSDIRMISERPCLLVVSDEKEAEKSRCFMSEMGLNASVFTYRDFIFHNITASRDYELERLGVLSSLIDNSCDVVISTPDAVLQYTIPKAKLSDSMMIVSSEDEISSLEITSFLVRSGYTQTELVDGCGQFSIRGGIIDIFSPGYEYPIRIELFGDEIDSMSFFDTITQRRTENAAFIRILPAKELLTDADSIERIKKSINHQLRRTTDSRARETLFAELEAIDSKIDLRFIDKYISLVYPEKECLLDYLGRNGVVVCQEYSACADRLKAYDFHLKESVTSLLEERTIQSSVARFGKWSDDFNIFLGTHPGLISDMFMSSIGDMKFSATFSMMSKQTVAYTDDLELLITDLKAYKSNGYKCLLLCENEVMARNLHNMASDSGMSLPIVSISDHMPDGVDAAIIHGLNCAGFELSTLHFAVLSTFSSTVSYSNAILKRRKIATRKSAQEKIMSYADLKTGDYIVHVNHGIGRFLGIESVTVEGVTKDYIKLEYAGTDRLFLPCNQLDSISKYIGAAADDGTLKLSRMGGTEWATSKSRVKTAAKRMAKELIKLYAERQRRPGFAFYPDDEMQRDFEASFPFAETEGQLQAIKEVKKDMETARPMDRLLCGDVGFGKTEVAVRAAFKAVESGKQVAVLVPTTILALQHYQTFLSRLRGFPVKVDMLSRFRNAKQQQETLRRIKRGETDILVGTHRIVSNDVSFKDLGLVIIDEEQRFGVAAKEKLKQLSSGVDTLTLTATPIPRTLNMAMSGIRDMSVLEEAPTDRVPVQTYVLEYDDVIIADAINKELRRGGQVFYLHNRVESIEIIKAQVQAMAPDAKIAVAHGKMDREELSDIWRSMLNGEIDVLVSTTIIESGIDIPNANTLIIENADRLGLSQLHQIRGRVGRSSRRAYAYFTYPKGYVLSDIAAKRLGAIREYTEFGSGFKVALRDLEIRGAGNLLGAEQHGHLDTVGYDMYMKLLNEAILEERGEVPQKKTECIVDMNISAYIPETYIHSAVQRIDVYKKISLVETIDDTVDIIDELLDRYGDLPKPVATLLDVSLLRSLGAICGIYKIQKKGSSVIFWPEVMDISSWSMVASEKSGQILISLDLKPYVTLRLRSGISPVDSATDVLNLFISIRNKLKENSK